MQPTATKIRVRGATEVVNQFGGNCLSCHAQAEAKWDMICEQGHGCAPIPVTLDNGGAVEADDDGEESLSAAMRTPLLHPKDAD